MSSKERAIELFEQKYVDKTKSGIYKELMIRYGAPI